MSLSIKRKERKKNSVEINYFTLPWNIDSQASITSIKKKQPPNKQKRNLIVQVQPEVFCFNSSYKKWKLKHRWKL